jgi:hypothetical protein
MVSCVSKTIFFAAVCLAGVGLIATAGKNLMSPQAPPLVVPIVEAIVEPTAAGKKADRLPVSTTQSNDEVIVAQAPRSDPPALPKSVSQGMSTRVADAYDAAQERRDPASVINDAPKANDLKPAVHEKWHRHWRHSSDHKANRALARRTVARHRRRPSVPAEPTQVQQTTECPSDGLKPWLRTLNLSPPCQG